MPEEDLEGDLDDLSEGQDNDETEQEWTKRKAELEKNIKKNRDKISKLKVKLGKE